MNKEIFKYILYSILAILLQVTFVNQFSVWGSRPDVFFICLIYITLNLGQIPGIIFAFFGGILIDMLTGGLIGSSSLSKVIAVFICGYFYNENRIDMIVFSYPFIFIVFLGSLIDNSLYTLFTFTSEIPNLFVLILNYSLLTAIYTSLLSSLVLLKSKTEVFGR